MATTQTVRQPVSLNETIVTLALVDVESSPVPSLVDSAVEATDFYTSALAAGDHSEEERKRIAHSAGKLLAAVTPTSTSAAETLEEVVSHMRQALALVKEGGRQRAIADALLQELWVLVKAINYAAHHT